MKKKNSLRVFGTLSLVALGLTAGAASAEGSRRTVVGSPAAARPLTALDKLEIMELAARFEMALDAEDERRFLATFVENGSFEGFGPKSVGRKGQSAAFHGMLNTFARGKRHCSMNQVIEGDGRRAVMTSYLVVFNRDDLERGGSARVKDTVVKQNGRWLIQSRRIDVDPGFRKLPK